MCFVFFSKQMALKYLEIANKEKEKYLSKLFFFYKIYNFQSWYFDQVTL